jgi:hypothetical protein
MKPRLTLAEPEVRIHLPPAVSPVRTDATARLFASGPAAPSPGRRGPLPHARSQSELVWFLARRPTRLASSSPATPIDTFRLERADENYSPVEIAIRLGLGLGHGG